ncbi:MAG: sigma-70 family RNA polymerase sigma factor [Planctomycetes bacterium]|nr:sigma-70 family RNA polymerase sigma factor [Planctomycetota bacterium]
MERIDQEREWEGIAPAVRGYLLRRLAGDEATADDLAQECFLRLYHHREDLRSDERFGPWTMRIARSVLIDHLRRRRPGVPVTEVAAVLPEEEDASLAEAIPLGRYVYTQIDALPAHEAVAIRLVDVVGMAPMEAAERLGLGLPALKARLRRGRQRLRDIIDRCCTVDLDGRGHPLSCEPRAAFAACC